MISFNDKSSVFIARHSVIHSLKLYKIADKTLLSNVNRKNERSMMKNYDAHPVFLKSMRVKKVTVGK